jgi:hypothetical protein
MRLLFARARVGRPVRHGAPGGSGRGEGGRGADDDERHLERLARLRPGLVTCEQSGDGCVPIGGASGAAYTPTGADVGHRLRSRVTATQVKSRSSDSDPSAVVIAADHTPPAARIRVARTTLQRVVKRGFIPVLVTCNEDCAIALRATVVCRLGKRLGGRRIGTGKGTGAPGKRVTIRVKLTRRARRGLRARRALAYTLRATVTDPAGNSGKATKRARVRRKRS